MGTPRKTRGEYRPFYEALFTGKDFKQLAPDAKLCLLTLKGLCGAIGIRTWHALPESLAELTGLTLTRVRSALKQLTESQWIELEHGVVWVVRGLEFEPQVSTGDKHRKWLQKQIQGFPTSPIVERFRRRYAEFFHDASADTPSDTLSDRVSDSPCDTTTPTPTPSPTPSPSLTPTTNPVRAADGEHRKRLVSAANAGIKALAGEQPHPITWDAGTTHEAARAFEDAQVELSFAEQRLFSLASAKLPRDGKPARHLKYFAAAVVDAWVAEQAHRLTATYGTPRVGGTARPVAGAIASDDEIAADMERRIAAGEFLPPEYQGVANG